MISPGQQSSDGRPALEYSRRALLRHSVRAASLVAAAPCLGLLGACDDNAPTIGTDPAGTEMESPAGAGTVTLFLAGDIMTGRGIDQILPSPGDPRLYESYIQDARRYVEIAEAVNGEIPRPAGFDYVWGDAVGEIDAMSPDARVANLETSITTSGDHWPGKSIHYRMHPGNIACLTALGLDCCTLANNHVLDWGYEGLEETLRSLERVGVASAGAGASLSQARAPAIIDIPRGGRLIVFSLGTASSGIPRRWAATADRAGVNLVTDPGPGTVREIAGQVAGVKREGDIVVASIHWGGNWGFDIPGEHRRFAHGLIDGAGVDVVHGHSSHHPLGVEVYRDRPILYGCGDLLNDYEGIGQYDSFRADLVLTYFPTIDSRNGRMIDMQLIPFQMKKMRLNRASPEDLEFMANRLKREGEKLGTGVAPTVDGRLSLSWS